MRDLVRLIGSQGQPRQQQADHPGAAQQKQFVEIARKFLDGNADGDSPV
jgi:hypothetical protein